MGVRDPASYSNASKTRENSSKATLAIRFDPTAMLLQVENVIPINRFISVILQNPCPKKSGDRNVMSYNLETRNPAGLSVIPVVRQCRCRGPWFTTAARMTVPFAGTCPSRIHLRGQETEAGPRAPAY